MNFMIIKYSNCNYEQRYPFLRGDLGVCGLPKICAKLVDNVVIPQNQLC